ncbi:hypothetical protein [Hanstruepera marina]|uniref:hypothetical protein n=1 Tax=Hanstruepera marina TaxID=2873265 RepID=UPI001CA6012A|nr:hypothetical protein [Hanstruepera marina]
MKTITNDSCPLIVFKKNKNLTRGLALILTFTFLNLIISCSYYNVKDLTTSPETLSKQIENFNSESRYAVIHTGITIWHLENIILNEDNKTITGIAQELSLEHTPLQPREKKRVHRYKRDKQEPFNELHLYLSSNVDAKFGSEVTIPFSDITSLSINERNSGRSVANVTLGVVGIIAGITIIVSALKGSCPFVYINNGEEFIFTGELYPGIITANQQRDDYLNLPNLTSNNGDFILRITNELKEIQYTDQVQLILAEHPENVEILLDKNGVPHSFDSILPPNLTDGNIKPLLKKDNTSYLFNSETSNHSPLRDITLEFDKPKQKSQAKLYLKVKNSMWLDYVFGKFNEQFGSYYNKFQKDQQSISKEESETWIKEQHIPLSVYIQTNKGWELVDLINSVGPMAYRNIVVPIDLKDIETDKLKIKLETGFMFWEVDYVGIDYSKNIPLQLQYLEPVTAITQDGDNVRELLSHADRNYFVQPEIGDQVEVLFKYNALTSKSKKSFFLKNRGYYNYIREYKGQPDFNKLKLFRNPGAFTEFSKLEYEALIDYSNSSYDNIY